MVRSCAMERVWLFSVLSLAAGCGDDGAASAEAPEPAAAAPVEASADATDMGVHYDLAAHLARAEMRRGSALLIDFGVPGGGRHTLGGWQTRTGDARDLDGTSALLIPGAIGKVIAPIESDGKHVLTLRARAFRDGRTTVYLGEATIGHARLPVDGEWATVSFELDAAAGEHFVQLRSAAIGAVPGGGSAGVAIDWMRIEPAPASDSFSGPPPPAEILRREGAEPVIVLRDGDVLGWHLDVPRLARLRGGVEGAGTLRITARGDRVPARALGSVRATDSGTDLDVGLDALEGEVVRIDLVADGGAVSVRAPVIVAPDDRETRELATRPRNVLVYLIDTLRADKLSAYEPGTRVRTPGLDRWVPSATVFERGQSQESWTKPSVATLLSGLMPWEHSATTGDAVVPSSVDLLSETLGEAGYHTGAFIANGYVSDRFGFEQGFRTFRNYIREGRRTQAEFVAADVLGWLDERPSDRPFFLYVHTIDPHVPYMPPAEILREYDPDPYDGPVDFGRDRELLEKIKIGRLRVNDRDRRRLAALYDGEITYHDTHLAAILDGLERRGVADDTVVVITADHGEEFFDHGSVGHGHSVFQELLHVPLIVRVPGLTDGDARIEDAVGLVDVAPTVLDVIGRPIPDEMSGRSLLPLLQGAPEPAPAPRAAVSGFMNGWRTVLIGRHKLVQRTAAHVSVFDLAADPGEQRDLAAERPITVRWLRGMLGLALAGELGTGRRIEHEEERTVIDAEMDAQLRALGYVGTSRPE